MDMRLGYCREIAESAGGKYYPISSLNSVALCSIVDREQQLLFEKNT
jgi:magnesium chelatase subunit D